MKKETLQRRLSEAYEQLDAARAAAAELTEDAYAKDAKIRALQAEVDLMKTHWRPVPITHEWQPRNPQCALCDEPRDAARHHVERSVVPDA